MANTLPALLAQIVNQFADRIAIQEPQQSITFSELDQQRVQAAKAFCALGVQHGDRVAIWAPNISEWIIASLGLQTIGAVLVPLNTRMKGSEAADIIERSGARVLLSVSTFHASAHQTIHYFDQLPEHTIHFLAHCVALCGDVPDGLANALSWQAFLKLGNTINDAEVAARAARVTEHDTMDMLFTSGTTGKPKGVMCAHEQNIKTVRTWATTVGLNHHDRYLIINPFFHSFGYKAGWLAALMQGTTIYPVKRFDLDEVLAQIQRDAISVLPGPPTIYQSMLMHPNLGSYDLSSLRLAVTGAAAVPVELIERMRHELHFQTVLTAYGLTETCGFVSICRPDDSSHVIASTSGKAMDGVEVKCVNEQGQSLPSGEVGEIWVRGYNVMKGYFDNPQATAQTITSDGWLKTGDVGMMDANGYLAITDRLKDMYISGGFNVYPAEIENAMASIAGVAQVAVIGVPDKRMGEVGKAFVVKAADNDVLETDILAWCKTHMANYKVPRSLVFVDALPLNASGKVLKTALRHDEHT